MRKTHFIIVEFYYLPYLLFKQSTTKTLLIIGKKLIKNIFTERYMLMIQSPFWLSISNRFGLRYGELVFKLSHRFWAHFCLSIVLINV